MTRPRLALDRKLQQPRNYDAALMLACVVFLVVWSAITLYIEFSKGAQP